MLPPLRTALLTYSTKPRGSVVHTLELAEALTALGHRVCIYALDKTGQGFERSLSCDVRLVPAHPAPQDIDGVIRQRIQELIAALQADAAAYDIYHAQDCITANALVELRQQGQIPALVRTIHHIEAFKSPYLLDCQHRSIVTPDLCLCVSYSWQKRLLQEYSIAAPRVPNGINLQRFSAQPSGQEAELQQRYRLTGSPIFLTVGGIEPRKNSLRLLEAFARVRQQIPTAQLVIAGGSTLFDYQSYRAEFFSLAEALAIQEGDSLILPGIIPEADLPVLYRLADGFCFPSVKEGWGLVVMEAIASGRPVLVSQQPPFTEFLSPNQAFWVDPTSVPSIAQAMLAMLDRSKAEACVRLGQTLLPQFAWERSARMHVLHYRNLLHQRARNRPARTREFDEG